MTNVQLLEQVMGHIEAYPEQHNQRAFFSRNECGTAGCVAGWACLLSGLKPSQDRWWTSSQRGWDSQTHILEDGSFVQDKAQELLNLDDYDAGILFAAGNSKEEIKCMVKHLSNGEHLDYEYDYENDRPYDHDGE